MARGRGPESNLVPEQHEAADSAGRHTPMRGLVKGLGREGAVSWSRQLAVFSLKHIPICGRQGCPSFLSQSKKER